MPADAPPQHQAATQKKYSARISVRHIFYIAGYILGLTFLKSPTIFILATSFFVLQLYCLRFCRPRRIGYIDIVTIVYFLYFVVVPMQQIDGQTFILGELRRIYSYPVSYFFIVYLLAAFSYLALIITLRRVEKISPQPVVLRPYSSVILFALAVMGWIFLTILAGGVENILRPRYEKEVYDLYEVTRIFLALQVIATFLYMLAPSSNRLLKLGGTLILLVLLAIVANPLNMARYVLLATWGPIGLIGAGFLLKPKYFFSGVLASILVIFPALSFTTRFGAGSQAEISGAISHGSVFLLKNMNVFEMGMEAVRYVDRYSLLTGEVLLSTIFFFVPRFIWEDKPLASNVLVGLDNVTYFGTNNTNLAIPWFMDGYMDFWYFGSIIYSVLFALFFGFLGRWLAFSFRGHNLFFYIFLVNAPILLRGTLAVVMALFLLELFFFVVLVKAFAREQR